MHILLNYDLSLRCSHELDGLENQLHRINEQLALKNHSLMLDNRCADVRKRLDVVDHATGKPIASGELPLSGPNLEYAREKSGTKMIA